VARAGEIVCTEPVARVAVAQQIVSSRPMGTVRLKNVLHAVTLYELGTGDAIGPLHHIDPVCRMQVSVETAPASASHDGVTFYFCSASCAERFQAAPDQYVAPAVEH
jgi:YHS domain-containing protein